MRTQPARGRPLRHLAARAAAAGVALLASLGLVTLTAPAAAAHTATPSNFESRVLGIEPSTSVVTMRVVGGDGYLDLHVERGHEVLVDGYSGEPWLRVLRDGTVEENTSSPATYLDENRYATDITIPPGVSAQATPTWKKVAGDGGWQWHDHRIHWMDPGHAPPMMPGSDQVRMSNRADGNWVVPLRVDGRPAQVIGELVLHPTPAPLPTVALIGGLLVAGLAVSLLLRAGRTRLFVAAIAALLTSLGATWLGYEQLATVPRVAGSTYVYVLIPLGGVVVSLGALALRGAVSRCLTTIGAAGCVLGWGIFQIDTLWKAVPLSVLPHTFARLAMAAAMGAALGVIALALRSGALAMPLPALVDPSEEAHATEVAAGDGGGGSAGAGALGGG